MKEDIMQIPRIPFFLKLKIVLIPVWELKVSKNRINYTSLCSCTHHVIKSHGSPDYSETIFSETIFKFNSIITNLQTLILFHSESK